MEEYGGLSCDIKAKIIDIQNKQRDSEHSFNCALKRIETMGNEVALETNFVGLLKADSVQSALSQLSSNTAGHFKAHYDGIVSLSSHINDIIDLIQMISCFETDLYHLLDEDSSVTNEHLRGIYDTNERSAQQIKGVIERTIILRDRLNGMKCHIEAVNNKYKKLILVSYIFTFVVLVIALYALFA